MKRLFFVNAKRDKDEKQFSIYTDKAHSSRIAEKCAKNYFYSDNVIIININ